MRRKCESRGSGEAFCRCDWLEALAIQSCPIWMAIEGFSLDAKKKTSVFFKKKYFLI
jgi:hypothetical protein